MPGATTGANSTQSRDDNDHTASGKLCDHDHGKSLFGGAKGRWLHAIRAWLPEEMTDFSNFAKYSPLIAAIIAPTSTLLDIPALSQKWYTYNGEPVPDPKACVALSAVGLTMNVLANLLLVLRFSHNRRRNHAVVLSLLFWIAKTIIALVNLCVFAGWSRNGPGYQYAQAFWCAVISLIMAGMCTASLLAHYFFAFGHADGDREDLRMTGRKFMLSETFFMFLLGMQALAFNRLEGWTYLDSIYFSLQCALTIGYGDLPPLTAAGKVLVFPFAVLTISQLANEVSIIIEFVQNRAQEKRDRWRKRFSLAMHREAIKRKPYATLVDEMSLIHQIDLHQETMQQTYDLLWSGLSLAAFWLSGAAIFNALEGWGYGNGIYAVMVLSLTIGFGDYTPESPAGRVVWVVYALMAVPVVTNFAVQTVTGIMYTWTEHRYIRARFELHREEDPEAFAPHSHFILRNHDKWDRYRSVILGDLEEEDSDAKEPRLDDALGHYSEPQDASHTSSAHDIFADASESTPRAQQTQSPSSFDIESDGTAPNSNSHLNAQPRRTSSESHTPMEEAEDMQEAADEARDEREDGNETDGELPALPAAGPRLADLNSRDGPAPDVSTNPGDLTNEGLAQLESKLLRELIDRVTKFEAQARQMLIDTMDRDLARTLLLADRNLQLRDAFHLYDDDQGVEDEPKNEEDAARRANIMDSEAAAHDEEMVSRVRRYRNAFAEILVLSSTLLKLEGEDLKRFERWRAGQIPKEAKKKEASKAQYRINNAEGWIRGRPLSKAERAKMEEKLKRKEQRKRQKGKGHQEEAENRLAEEMDAGPAGPAATYGMGITQGALPLPSAVLAAHRARKMRHKDEEDQIGDETHLQSHESHHNDRFHAEAERYREKHPLKHKIFHGMGERIFRDAEEEAGAARSIADWVVDKSSHTFHRRSSQHKAKEQSDVDKAMFWKENRELAKHDHVSRSRSGSRASSRPGSRAGSRPRSRAASRAESRRGREGRHEEDHGEHGSDHQRHSARQPATGHPAHALMDDGGDTGGGPAHAADPIHNVGAQAVHGHRGM